MLLPDGAEVSRLAAGHEDVTQALNALADEVNAGREYPVYELAETGLPSGKLNTATIAAIVSACLPEGSIICGDSGGGGAAFAPTQSSRPNSWLNLTGGSIGQGGPAAVGAAVACPDRQVLALLGDGATMYTNQAFWTQAREGLNVTTVVFNNSRYGILETEYLRLGVNEIGPRAADLFDLSRPEINFVGLAASMGVPGERVDTAEGFASALKKSFEEPGPYLIEAQV